MGYCTQRSLLVKAVVFVSFYAYYGKAEVPSAPFDVRLVSCSARVVQLEWKHVSNDSVSVQQLQFVIEYNTSFQPHAWHVAKTQLPRDRHYQRIALSPWGNYSFRVLAQNADGVSEPSAPTRDICTTAPDVPHINPHAVCTRNVRPHTLVITWQLMTEEEHNGPGFHYVVRWRRHDLAPTAKFEERPVDSKSNMAIIDGQSVYKPYEIYVLAVNDAGDAVSPPRMLIGYSSEDKPREIPQNFRVDPSKPVTDRTADFLWDAVNTGPWRMQGFFRGYKIQFWKTTEGMQTMREHSIIYREPGACWSTSTSSDRLRRDVNSGHVYNLWPFTNITAQIRVLNAKYDGPPSSTIAFFTAEGECGAVRAARVTDATSRQLRLSWNRPFDLNGILLGYSLTYTVIKPPESAEYNSEKRLDLDEPRSTRVTLKGLQPLHTYRLTLSCVNRRGPGTPVSVIATTLPAPMTPKFTTVNFNRRALNVTWFVTSDQLEHATITVCYRKLGDETWTSLVAESTAQQWTVVQDLESGVTYEVKVIAAVDGAYCPETHTAVRRVDIDVRRGAVHWSVTDELRATQLARLEQLDPQRKVYEIKLTAKSSTSDDDITSVTRVVSVAGEPDAQPAVADYSSSGGGGSRRRQVSVSGLSSLTMSTCSSYLLTCYVLLCRVDTGTAVAVV